MASYSRNFASPFATARNAPTFEHTITPPLPTHVNEYLLMRVYSIRTIPESIHSRITPHNKSRFMYTVSMILHEMAKPEPDTFSLWNKISVCLNHEDYEYLKPKENENMLDTWFKLVYDAVNYIQATTLQPPALISHPISPNEF